MARKILTRTRWVFAFIPTRLESGRWAWMRWICRYHFDVVTEAGSLYIASTWEYRE